MSDWIKLETGLRRHPKVVRMSEHLSCDALTIVGALYALWSVADEHSTNGKLVGYTPEFVDSDVRIKGFSQALCDVGWLVVTPDGIEIPRFKNHNGRSAKRRASEQKRKRNARRDDREEEGRARYARHADNKGTRARERSNTTSGGKPPSVARARRCPPGFAVSADHRALAAELRIDLDAELAIFRDHEFATPRSDWAATLRNWLRKAAASPRPTSAPSPRRPSTGAALSTPRTTGASPHDPRPEPPPVDVVDVHATRVG